jgi:hypothetical protein
MCFCRTLLNGMCYFFSFMEFVFCFETTDISALDLIVTTKPVKNMAHYLDLSCKAVHLDWVGVYYI